MYLKSQNSFLAAVYLRLSKDDGDKMESDSIRNQRSFVTSQSNIVTLHWSKNMLTMDSVVQILSVQIFRR